MAYSNNAQNIWAFRINRVEPLEVPLLSRLTGPFRYEFLVGPLGGHTLIPSPDPAAAGRCDQSRQSLGACGKGEPQADAESGVWL
jgi:hypothetical protein